MESPENYGTISRWRAFVLPIVAANLTLFLFCLRANTTIFHYAQLGGLAGAVYWRFVFWPTFSATLLLLSALWNYSSHTVSTSVIFFAALVVWYSSGVLYIGLLA